MDSLWENMSGHSFDALRSAVMEIVYSGYPMFSILSQLHDDTISRTDLEDVDKALICEKLAEVRWK